MKKYFTILILLLFSTGISAQSVLSKSFTVSMPQVTLPSPQAMLFEKYLNHEISEYSGTPDISIPLYEIEIKGVKIPIILSYDASGIKFKQFDGDVGTGWNINTNGFRVSRKIYGRDDLIYSEMFNSTKYNQLKKDQTAMGFYWREAYLASFTVPKDPANRKSPLLNNSDLTLRDTEYDHFSYNMPSTNGNFILKDRINKLTDITERNRDIITFDKTYNIVITDNFGNRYNLNEKEFSPKIDPAAREITSWLLTSVQTPFNEQINFSYNSFRLYNKNYNKALIVNDMLDYDKTMKSVPYSSVNSESRSVNPDLTYLYSDTKYLDQISLDNCIVKFNRGVTLNNRLFSHMVNNIQITSSGNILHTIKFYYKVTPGNVDLSGNTEYGDDLRKPYQILLTSISVDDKIYKFDYYEIDMPKPYPDEWGYYNSGHTSLYDGWKVPVLHQEFEKDFTSGSTQIGAATKGAFGNGVKPIFADRNVNVNYVHNYSIKKITYPTGGYTEYKYEPNKLKYNNKVISGPGIRVKEILSVSESGKIPITSIFKYGQNEDGLGITKGGLEYVDYKRGFCDISFSLNRDNQNHSYLNEVHSSMYNVFTTVRTYSTQALFTDFELYSQVLYPQVTVYKYDSSNNSYLGKTVSNYENLKTISFQSSYNEGPMFLPVSFNNVPVNYQPKVQMNGINGFHTSAYSLGFRPNLKSRKYYKKNDSNPISEEIYVYSPDNSSKTQYNSYIICQLIGFDTGYEWKDYSKQIAYVPPCPYQWVYSQFRMGTMMDSPYKSSIITMGTPRLNSKTVNQYDGGTITSTETYEYDAQNRPQKTIQTNSTGGKLVKELIYPAQSTELVKRNMVSIVIETITTHNNKEIGRIRNNYPANAIQPSSVQSSASGTASLRTDLIYDLYDSKGNIRQLTTIDGVSTVYLWSYKGQYPVAEIKYATFASVNSALSSAGLTSADALSGLIPDDAIINKLKNLRSLLPDSFVSVYKYKPLVGILEVTDPSGITIKYEYDSFGRLMWTKDPNGKTVQEYNYHYRNQ